MAGPGLDLPLFIPDIQTGTGQTNVDLTSYSTAISYEQTWTYDVGAGPVNVAFVITPPSYFMLWEPENINTVIAPIPRSPASPNYVGLWSNVTPYVAGQIVTLAFTTQNNGTAPYYVCNVANTNVNPTSGTVVSTPGPNFGKPFWLQTSASLGVGQDVSSFYYQASTYQHVVSLVNKSIYDDSQNNEGGATINPSSAWAETYKAFYDAWIAAAVPVPFPYPTLGDFANVIIPPVIKYDEVTGYFSIIADSDAYGERIQTFAPPAPVFGGPAQPLTPPVCRLFMNTNMFGLFANFPNRYYNKLTGIFSQPNPSGYTNEILIVNKDYTNVLDFRQLPYSAYVPNTSPNTKQKPYWLVTQEAISTDSLWSPIQALVFTSTLLPIQNESGGPPIDLGGSNLGFSTATVRSAFEPIITDIILPLGDKGAIDYRGFIYYAPTAEYRLADFTANTEIRNIDIQIYYRNRLDNNLYPVSLYNQSNISLKFMFRKKSADLVGRRQNAGAFS